MTHLSSLLIARISALPFETLDSLAGDRSRLAAEAWLSRLADRADEAERISNLLHAAAGEAGSQGRNVARGAVLQVRRAIHQDRAVGHRLLEEAGPLLTGELQAGVRRHLDHGSEVAQARETFSVVYAEERAQAGEAIVQTLEMPLFHLGLRLSGRALARRADGLSRLDPESWDQR